MATVTTEMPASGKSGFREEYCPSHLQVEWEVSYETLQKSVNGLRSPVFKICKQSYMLESKQQDTECVDLLLLRMGPSISDRPFGDQVWGGLKRTDGDYDLICESQQSYKNWEIFGLRSFKTEVTFWIRLTTDLDRLYLTPDGCLKFFLRMNTKKPLVGVGTCIHGTSPMPNEEAGSIRQEKCSHHQHVEWNISYETQKDNESNLTSPVFKIGTQMYFFHLSVYGTREVRFRLFRLGSSVDGPAAEVRYWIGLKCADGTYHPRNFSDKLDLSEDFGLWTDVYSRIFYHSDLEKHYQYILPLNRRLTFFLKMNVDSKGADLCRHGTPDEIAPQATGKIQEEQCSSHKQVEWDVDYEVLQDRDSNKTSPVFKIGTQVYFLETCFHHHGGVSLYLFRLGRSIRGSDSTPRCWVGLARKDGTYYYETTQVDLREDFWLWTYLDDLMYILPTQVTEQYLTPDSKLTFLFRMNTETTGPQTCTHGLAEMPSLASGRIREVLCSSHKEVEWDINFEGLLEHKSDLRSPVFKIDSQMYYLELAGNTNYIAEFSLYRLGRSVEGRASSVRCWGGLKYPDVSYQLRSASRKLDLHDDFALWTFVTTLIRFRDAQLANILIYVPRLTFFFRMNVEPTGTEKCIHGPIDSHTTGGEGDIEIEECTSHKHVLWDVKYEASRKDAYSSTSPVFKIGNQWYQLDVYYDPVRETPVNNRRKEKPVTLQLCRSGYPVEGPASSVLCWAGLKSGDASYYHHHIQMVEVDISEEFSLPTVVASFVFPVRSDLERTHLTSEGSLTFWLQMNVPQGTVDEVACIHGAFEMCPPGDGSIRERSENLVEWHVGYEEPREYTHFSTSPVFKMGNQCYLLELCYEMNDFLALSLYRFGRSVEGLAGSVRCWAGGTYHHNIQGVEFDLGRDCELWMKVKILGYFRRCDLENECLMKNGRLTFFCLINTEGRESKAVAVQTDGNRRGGHEDRLSRDSEDFKKLQQDFRLWLEHPEEGDRIRQRRREEFQAKQWNVLENEGKEPSIFAA